MYLQLEITLASYQGELCSKFIFSVKFAHIGTFVFVILNHTSLKINFLFIEVCTHRDTLNPTTRQMYMQTGYYKVISSQLFIVIFIFMLDPGQIIVFPFSSVQCPYLLLLKF